jgi:hypothetical protein
MVLPKEKKGSRSKKRDPDLILLERNPDPAFDRNVNVNSACLCFPLVGWLAVYQAVHGHHGVRTYHPRYESVKKSSYLAR